MEDTDPASLSELLDDEGDRSQEPQPLHGWAVVATLAVAIVFGSLLGAGAVLSEGGLGRSSVARGCSAKLGAGLMLFVFAGALFGVVRVAVDRRFAQEVVFDHTRFWALLPAPALLLLLSAPAFLGCEVATDIANMDGLGRTLTGTPGIALLGASAFAVGLVPTMAVRTRVPVSAIVQQFEQLRASGSAAPDPVERVLAALEEGTLAPSSQQYDTYTGARLDSVIAQDLGVDPAAHEPGAHPVTERPPDRREPVGEDEPGVTDQPIRDDD